MTSFGLVLIPLCLAVALRPLLLLQVAMIASIFEAAAALALGGFGLQPAMLPAAMFSAYIFLQMLLGVQYAGQREIWRPLLPMAIFTVWALSSSIVMPYVFEGQVTVHPQKLEPPFTAILLKPSSAGLNQDIYLAVNCAMLFFTGLFTSALIAQPAKIIKAYFLSGYIAVFIGIWQFGNKVAGVPFPDSFFYSNPGWAILSTQQVGLVPRINGPFSEPSSYAGFMVSIVCSTAWITLNGTSSRYIRVLLACSLAMVLLSTSTTGYVVLTIFAAALALYALLRGTRKMQQSVLRLGLITVFTATLLGMASTAFLPSVNKAASLILSSTLEKQDSQSYEERSAADADSMTTAVQTYFLGAGWGANRSSSLIPGLLANVGAIGVLCLVWFALEITRLVVRAMRVMTDPGDIIVVRGVIGATFGSFTAALLSGPTINGVSFFILLGLLIGTSARALALANRAYSTARLRPTSAGSHA